ncbi:MAG: transposase [Chloroflexi bacterium]|nr:transposase [Chloroflexota bacterium]
MSRDAQLSEWTTTVSTNLPQLSKPQATVLALWSFGIAFTRSCGRGTVATFLSLLLEQKRASIEQRLYDWCLDAPDKAGGKRQAVDVTTCFVPLLRRIVRLWTGTQLALTVDASSLGDRFVVLAVSVVYRGCAIPVAWTILPAKQQRAWRREWLRMLRLVRPAIPPDWTVLVLADRGLYARWLFRRIVRLGWHPFLRVNQGCKFRPAGTATFVWLTELCGQVGQRWRGRGTAFSTKESQLECTLVAWWGEGHKEPWYILTDLAPEGSDAQWYALRGWCEQGFKCIKRGGWQWQLTQMAEPSRAERVWLALALATLWVVSVGSELEVGGAREGEPRAVVEREAEVAMPDVRALLGLGAPSQPRRLRLFRLGWLWLLVQGLKGQALALPQCLKPEPWPDIPQPLGALLPLHKRLSYAYM